MAPGLQRYDCSGCGDCCRGRFAILITEEDRDRIVGQGWTDTELGLDGRALFKKVGENFHLAHRSNGSCVFLQEDGLCRIHAQHGEAAKPLACRMYPFRLIPLGSQVRVDVRFDCPSTAGNLGRPIHAHHSELNELMKAALPAEAEAQPVPALYGTKIKLTWVQLGRVTEAFEQVILDVSVDLTRRVRACVNLSDLIRRSDIQQLEGTRFSDFLDGAVAMVQQEAIEDPLVRMELTGMERGAFRQVLGVYGRIDQVGEKAKPIPRLSTLLRMLAGKGMVPPLREGFPKVTFEDVETWRGIPRGEAAGALERYLHVHLSGMGFFGISFYGRSYLDGLNALLLTFPLVCWFARAYAVSEGLSELDGSCVQRALMIVDHQHGITPVLDFPSERYRTTFLCEQTTLRTLMAWYGS